MAVYRAFAEVYGRGGYPAFSARVARLLPKVLRRFRARPRTVLDLACGEGTFGVAMAKRGYEVVGADLSPDMIRLARRRARDVGVPVRFRERDMRDLRFRAEFDLVTCWYDSLNYLLTPQDLRRTFAGVSRSLKEGGLFIFDMNTEFALSVLWQRNPWNVQQDRPETFEVHRPSWDANRRIASLRVTAFVRRGPRWARVDEVHRERAYSLPDIRECLRRAGLRELACWGSIGQMTPPRRGTRRYWFVARR